MTRNIHAEEYVYHDPTDVGSKSQLTTPDNAPYSFLQTIAIGLFGALSIDVRTFLTDRYSATQRVSAGRVAYAPFLLQPVPSSDKPPDLAAKISSGPTYTFDKILDHRFSDGDNTSVLRTLLPPESRALTYQKN